MLQVSGSPLPFQVSLSVHSVKCERTACSMRLLGFAFIVNTMMLSMEMETACLVRTKLRPKQGCLTRQLSAVIAYK